MAVPDASVTDIIADVLRTTLTDATVTVAATGTVTVKLPGEVAFYVTVAAR